MKKTFVLIVIVAISVFAGVLVGCGGQDGKVEDDVMKEEKTNPEAVDYFTYNRGGGELNAFYCMYLKGNQLTVERSEGNGSKTHKKKYKVPSDVSKSIETVLANAGIRQWGNNFAIKEEVVLDGETTAVTVAFSDGTVISFSSDFIIPQGGWSAVNDVVKLLEGVANK